MLSLSNSYFIHILAHRDEPTNRTWFGISVWFESVEVCPGRTRERDAAVCGVPGLGGLMQLGDGVKLVICMVGVSGCGKTYLLMLSLSHDVRYVANKIRRFLTWKGYQARVFSCTEVRKKNYPSFSSPSAEYWNPKNEEVGLLIGQDCNR